jgi:hypothetical protein
LIIKSHYSYLVATLAAIVLLANIGCGASADRPPAPPPPPIDEDLLSLAPDAADAVLWVDMAELRSSALFEALKTLVGDEGLPFMEGGSPINLIDTSDEIIFAFASGKQNGPDQFLILIKGKFKSLDLMDEYSKKRDSDNDQSVSEQIGSFPGIRTPKYIIMALTDRTLALSTEMMALKVADLASHTGGGLRAADGFKELNLDGSVAALLRYRRGVSAPVFDRYGAGGPPIDLASIAGLDGSLILKDGFHADVSITTETQMDASEILRELEGTIRDLEKNMFVLLIGIDWVFDRITLASEQTSVQIKVDLEPGDIEQIKLLADRLRKVRELTEAGDQQDENPLRLPLPNSPKRPGDKQ